MLSFFVYLFVGSHWEQIQCEDFKCSGGKFWEEISQHVKCDGDCHIISFPSETSRKDSTWVKYFKGLGIGDSIHYDNYGTEGISSNIPWSRFENACEIFEDECYGWRFCADGYGEPTEEVKPKNETIEKPSKSSTKVEF